MKKWLIAVVGLISIVVMVAGCAGAPEKAITPEEFYRGKIVTMVLPHAPGGGNDLWARIASPFLVKELGAKAVVVENMSGGGGYPAVNWIYSSAPRDGSYIAFTVTDKIAFSQLFDLGYPIKVKDYTEFSIIAIWGEGAAYSPYTLAVTSPDSPWNSIRELVGLKNLTTGCAGPYGSAAWGRVAYGKCLGIENYAIIAGYAGTADTFTACYRGEVDFISGSLSTMGAMVRQGMLKPIGGNMGVRNVEYPDLLTLKEVAVPGTERWIDLYDKYLKYLRTFFAPPQIPKDRLDFLREAMTRIAADPDYLKTMERLQIDFSDFCPGKEAEAIVKAMADPSTKSERDEYKAALMAYEK